LLVFFFFLVDFFLGAAFFLVTFFFGAAFVAFTFGAAFTTMSLYESPVLVILPAATACDLMQQARHQTQATTVYQQDGQCITLVKCRRSACTKAGYLPTASTQHSHFATHVARSLNVAAAPRDTCKPKMQGRQNYEVTIELNNGTKGSWAGMPNAPS
jgi:hypothetical protein